MNRFGAFAVHLGISIVIFAALGYLILFHWYPDFFFASDGGWQGIRIVALVDLVLGPTLTLVVYKKGKPSLRFDLTCIGVLQAVCLAAGVWVVYSERPIAMVFSDGTFTSMTTGDYEEYEQEVPDWEGFPGPAPIWISVRLPEDPSLQATARQKALQSGKPLRTFAEFYEAFEPDHVNPDRDGLSTRELTERDSKTPFLDQFFLDNGGSIDDYVFLPFGTRYRLALIALRKRDQELVFLAIPDSRG